MLAMCPGSELRKGGAGESNNSAQSYKVVVFGRVRTDIYPGYDPTKKFRKFCRTSIPVPGTSVSSVRH